MVELIIAALPFFYLQFVASMTPGPNNVMLTASAINFGYKRTLPHIFGVIAGFGVINMLAYFGVGAIYESMPQIEVILKTLGSAYLLYLSYKIATAGRVGLKNKASQAVRPMRFIEGLGFQFINPKGVVFAFTLVALLPSDKSISEHVLIIFISTLITSACSTHTWALFGKIIAGLFRDDKTRNVINIILAIMLLATIPMMVM